MPIKTPFSPVTLHIVIYERQFGIVQSLNILNFPWAPRDNDEVFGGIMIFQGVGGEAWQASMSSHPHSLLPKLHRNFLSSFFSFFI